ncbi:MAG: DUF1501 domain-containing protein [Verrucomicrobia bacterium]|nr:DUF1501 domain-containing protein [Verrucomicrobiota bacterium]
MEHQFALPRPRAWRRTAHARPEESPADLKQRGLLEETVVVFCTEFGRTPAERAGVGNEVGCLARGKRADVLVLNRQLKVKRVFLAGAELLR